jgi:hypothetical protein
MYRQGDLLITKIDSLPTGLKEIPSGIVLRGEVTGHAHRLVDGDVFSDKNGLLYLAVANIGQLVHEEHKPIKLSKGLYKIVRQREYTNKDAVRLVVD